MLYLISEKKVKFIVHCHIPLDCYLQCCLESIDRSNKEIYSYAEYENDFSKYMIDNKNDDFLQNY